MNLLIFVVFAALAFVSFGLAFAYCLADWREWRDEESRKWLLASGALFASACLAVVTIGLAVAGVPLPLRQTVAGMTWGAFAVSGLAFLDAVRQS